VVAPWAVTWARVGVAPLPAGQFVPFCRQTFVPPTRRAVETSREEPVAFTKLKLVMVPVVERRFVIEASVAMSEVP
jgi:hypothetical protein